MLTACVVARGCSGDELWAAGGSTVTEFILVHLLIGFGLSARTSEEIPASGYFSRVSKKRPTRAALWKADASGSILSVSVTALYSDHAVRSANSRCTGWK